MADPVIVQELPNRLRIRFDEGIDPETGKSILRSKSYGNIKTGVPPQVVYDFGVALALLCANPVVDYIFEEDKALTS
jgi:hypothetical protein